MSKEENLAGSMLAWNLITLYKGNKQFLDYLNRYYPQTASSVKSVNTCMYYDHKTGNTDLALLLGITGQEEVDVIKFKTDKAQRLFYDFLENYIKRIEFK